MRDVEKKNIKSSDIQGSKQITVYSLFNKCLIIINIKRDCIFPKSHLL